MTSRRKFIATAAQSTAALAAMPSFGAPSLGAQVDKPDPHFLVYVQIYGAWDVCLAFDPKDRDLRLSNGQIAFDQPYAMSEVKQFSNGIMLAPQGFPLGRFSDRLAVVNGIDMELDNGHTPVIAMTGDPTGANGGKPSLQAILSQRHPYVRGCLLPHLYASYDGFFASGPHGAKTTIISAADAYKVLLGSGGSDSLKRVARLTDWASLDYQGSARQSILGYVRALGKASALRDQLGGGGQAPLSPPDSIPHFAEFTAALFKAGVMGSITWSLGQQYFFDTHFTHYALHPLDKAIQDLAAFCGKLGEIGYDDHSSMLERTTLVVTAEYARTPRLNSSDGKDHNFSTNSVLFVGKNVRPGVFGQSGERQGAGVISAHAGLPIDFASGKSRADGAILKMRNVWAGASKVLGVELKDEFGNGTTPVLFLG